MILCSSPQEGAVIKRLITAYYHVTAVPHVTQDHPRVRDPGSSFCRVQRKLLQPLKECCQQTHVQFTGGHAAGTDSSFLPWTQLTSPAGLDKALLKYCRSVLLSNTLQQCEKVTTLERVKLFSPGHCQVLH